MPLVFTPSFDWPISFIEIQSVRLIGWIVIWMVLVLWVPSLNPTVTVALYCLGFLVSYTWVAWFVCVVLSERLSPSKSQL